MPARSRRWPDPRVKPPYGAAAINWSHPLAAGLQMFFLFNEGGGTRVQDLTGLQHATITDPANVTWRSSCLGLGLTNTASASTSIGITLAPALAVQTGLGWTWDSRFRPTSAGDANFSPLLTEGVTRGVYFAPASGKLDFFAAGHRMNATAITMGTAHHYGISVTPAAEMTFYLDGVPDGTATSITGTVSFNTMLNDTDSETFDGDCAYQRLWNRALSAGEMQWLAAEPYALLRPVVRRRYVPAAAGGSSTVPAKMHHYSLLR